MELTVGACCVRRESTATLRRWTVNRKTQIVVILYMPRQNVFREDQRLNARQNERREGVEYSALTPVCYIDRVEDHVE